MTTSTAGTALDTRYLTEQQWSDERERVAWALYQVKNSHAERRGLELHQVEIDANHFYYSAEAAMRALGLRATDT